MIQIPPESYIGTVENPYHAKITIGKYTSIANGLKVITASHPSLTDNTISNYPFAEKKGWDCPKCRVGGKVYIGNDVWIGEDVRIVGEVKIGDGAIIGAFSVVASDVEPYSIVIGNPAKIIRYRFDKEKINNLLKVKWWDFSESEIKKYLYE